MKRYIAEIGLGYELCVGVMCIPKVVHVLTQSTMTLSIAKVMERYECLS